MLSEALITEVDEMLPMVTNMEASATVVAEELDQYMPMAHEPAVKRPMAASSGHGLIQVSNQIESLHLPIMRLKPTRLTRKPASM